MIERDSAALDMIAAEEPLEEKHNLSRSSAKTASFYLALSSATTAPQQQQQQKVIIKGHKNDDLWRHWFFFFYLSLSRPVGFAGVITNHHDQAM